MRRARIISHPAELAFTVELARLPLPIREHRFAPPRRWRFDLAWPEYKLAVEVDGGGFVNGRHSRGTGMERDCEKYAAAMLLGWRVLRVTPRLVENGTALNWVEKLLGKV